MTLLLAALPAGAQPVQPGIWRLDGIDPALPAEDLEPLRSLIGKAPVVALGESYHTSGGFYLLKHRIFRYLVEQMGFRAFAIESNWTGVDLAERYVQTCEGSPEQAISRHWAVFQSTELADLARWMCEWNRAHPKPADKVHFFGFDIQQPEDDGPALIAFLQRTGTPEDHRWIEGIQSCEAVTVRHDLEEGIPPEPHARCIQALKEIDAHFQRNGRTLTRQTSKQDFATARLQLVGLRAWENAAFLSSRDFPASITARDEAMAYAFLTLRAMRFPKARTMIWAANLHVARAVLPSGARPMGSFLAAALGRNYLTFALTAYDAEIDYPQFGCGAVDRPAGSVEERLREAGEEALLVDLGTRNPYLPGGVLPMGTFLFEPYRDYNGILYLEHSAKMHPLRWPSCR